MIDRNSPLSDGTFGKVLSELEEKLRETEDRAKYWQDKYDKALHSQIEYDSNLTETKAKLKDLQEHFAEVCAENNVLKSAAVFGFAEQAHGIALEYLKRMWKDKTIIVGSEIASMNCYISAYKYAIERLEKKFLPKV